MLFSYDVSRNGVNRLAEDLTYAFSLLEMPNQGLSSGFLVDLVVRDGDEGSRTTLAPDSVASNY